MKAIEEFGYEQAFERLRAEQPLKERNEATGHFCTVCLRDCAAELAGARAAVREARTVKVTQKSTVTIDTGVLQSTLLVLPEDEKIAAVFEGDKENWRYDTTKLSGRFLSVKPTAAGVSTDLHIISDHGNSYSFILREVSGKAGAAFDSKVFLEAADDATRASIVKLPLFVPVDEVERYRKQAEEARAAAARRPRSRSRKSRSTSRKRRPERRRSGRPIPASSASITGGTPRWARNSAFSRSFPTTDSPTSGRTRRRRRRCTRSKTTSRAWSTSISRTAFTPFRNTSSEAISPSAKARWISGKRPEASRRIRR